MPARGPGSVAAMRRTVPPVLLAPILVLGLVACGSDSGSGADSTAGSTADSTGTLPGVSTPAGSDPTTTVDASAPSTTSPDKPEVSIPDEIPTELQVTVLKEGSGPAAATGDTVVVDYVGVRSSDGVEFDNSYDRNEPLPVVLGSGGVIQGWEQGLVGAQAGAQLQLDIPSDLAYGAQSRGDVIGENEALTFVVDVRAVIPKTNPADAPTESGVPRPSGRPRSAPSISSRATVRRRRRIRPLCSTS